jgi:hypothetical protein
MMPAGGIAMTWSRSAHTLISRRQLLQVGGIGRILLSGQPRPAADDPSYGSVLARLRPSTRNIMGQPIVDLFG